ncbi:MAG: hypothetical protein WC547_06545, partial [Candidatus Omnitrophota bacterium]
MKKNRIDSVFWAIAFVGPVLWIIDCLAIAVIFKVNFFRQLFFPSGFDLVLCLLLLFFPLLVALLFRPRPLDQAKLEEQREIEDNVRLEERKKSAEQAKALEAKFAQELELKLAAERKRVE